MFKKSEPKVKEKRMPHLWEAITPIVLLIVLCVVGIRSGLETELILLVSAAFVFFIGKRCGYNWKEMEKFIGDRIGESMPALMIMLVVGMLMASWMFSGTIPMIIFYGVQLISIKYMLVSAFILCAIISIATGTSYGSAATGGLSMVFIASSMDMNIAAVAGAAWAGAIFGDKLSPLSDTTILASLIADVDIFRHIKHMLWTVVPASCIGLVVYFILGSRFSAGTGGIPERTTEMLSALEGIYHFNFIILIPMLLILVGAVLRYPTTLVMIVSSVVAIVIGTFAQGFHFIDGFNCLLNGFTPDIIANANPLFNAAELNADVGKLVDRGGLAFMMDAFLVIICGFAFCAIADGIGCLRVAVNTMLKAAKGVGGMVTATVLSAFTIAGLGGGSSIAILVAGSMFKDKFKEKGLAPENLSRTLEDGATMTAGLFPWTSSGAYYASVFGVQPWQYGPYGVMCYLCLFIAIFYGFTGIAIKKLPKEEQLPAR